MSGTKHTPALCDALKAAADALEQASRDFDAVSEMMGEESIGRESAKYFLAARDARAALSRARGERP